MLSLASTAGRKQGPRVLMAAPAEEDCDPHRPPGLAQIVLNLLNNASSSPSVAACASKSRRACWRKERVEFSVQDTGVGIRPEDHPRFQAFHPGRRCNPRQEGTGLGLHVSQKLAGCSAARLLAAASTGRAARSRCSYRINPWPLDASASRQGDIGRNVAFPRVRSSCFRQFSFNYVKAEMRRVLADQQLAFVSRVADENRPKAGAESQCTGSAAQGDIRSEWLPDVEKLKRRSPTGKRCARCSTTFHPFEQGQHPRGHAAAGRRGINVSDQENFRTTLATRKAFISKPFVGKVSKQPVVTMTAPIFDRHGKRGGDTVRVAQSAEAKLPLVFGRCECRQERVLRAIHARSHDRHVARQGTQS